MVGALAGADYLVTRNVIGALPVLAVVVAAGLAAAGPSGLMGATALCAISLAAVTSVNLDPQLQRDDWRGVARALGPPRAGRVLLVRPASALAPLRVYRPGVRDARAGGVDTAELVVVELAERRPGLARLVPAPVLPSGLRTASGACRQVREDTFSLARCPVKPPRPVSPADLLAEEPARAVLHDAPTAP